MTERKIKLKVIPTEADYDANKVLGRKLFPELYSNIYIAGRKKSGKTQLLYNILEKCANKSTKVLLFSATANKDATYKEIKKMLDRKGIDHETFEHFINEEGEDLLASFIQQAKESADEEREEVPVPESSRKYVPIEEARVLFGDEVPRAKIAQKQREEQEAAEELAKKQLAKKKKKERVLAPEYILCFDDLGDDLRKKSISQLLIKNRHFKCKTIILSQWITYLPPTAIRQLDYVLLFGGFNGEKLEDLHTKLDLSDTFEEFEREYKDATAQKYKFLYIDIADSSYKHDFNRKLSKPSESQ